jgi:cation:H+ antiporter
LTSPVVYIHQHHLDSPWFFLAIFLAASFLMIWRLESMSANGMEGTVLGTVIMPYCSGLGNLIFAFLLGMRHGSGSDVMTNCLVNNVTNLTLIVGLPAIFTNMSIVGGAQAKEGKKKSGNTAQLNRLSLLLTLIAVLFFTGTTWALGRDGRISYNDGLVLVGLFLFWQCFHVYEVLKTNVQKNRTFGLMLLIDLALLGVGAYGIYLSTDWLVDWISHVQSGFISAKYLGWLSGWLMVLPNALLALYYAWKKQPEVVYSSQVGDGHICIPLCIGVYALYQPLIIPAYFQTGVFILCAATIAHIFYVAVVGKLTRPAGWVLCAAYVWFLYRGLK